MNKITAGIMAVMASVLIAGVPVFAGTSEVTSKVTKVILYRDAAQVTRHADIEVQEGSVEVIITGIPEIIDADTLTVAANGTARAKIANAVVKEVFLEKDSSEKFRQLEDAVRATKLQIGAYEDQLAVIAQEREFLKSIQLFSATKVPENLVTKIPNPDELSQTLGFIKDKWQDTCARELDIKEKERQANEKREAQERERDQARHYGAKERRDISVEFDVEKAGTIALEASYLIHQARWRPQYDARVNYDLKKVDMTCFGMVTQSTGADWNGVDVVLSTAKPMVFGKMPEMQSWVVRPPEPAPVLYGKFRSMAMYKHKGMMQAEAPAGAKMDLDGEKSEEIINADAQVSEEPTSVRYTVARPADIKSGGTEARLPIFAQQFAAQFYYAASPRLSPFAYLATKITNNRELLLAAGVRVFFDGVYVGSSAIGNIGTGEEIELYLGIDEGLKVKREKTKEETKEVWVAGIKRSTKVIIANYKITVENYKTQPVKVNLFDQVPVSGNNQIAVKVLSVEPKPKDENYKDRKGVMLWSLELAAKEKKEILVSFQVECPQEMHIEL
ncbi:MAG: DUF4139 domain-containing protein [Candidatus Omnitrophota bacterium]